jgi:L,D-peptidoglycan transpeptidase YkuD (ErfK/YbiS/YcfS/YnhG family)
VQVNANHYWSGDWNYKYNQFVDLRHAPADFNKDRSERLIDYAPNYNYALSFNYNGECTHGKGYAFFMQCLHSVKPWTGGGIAIPEAKMLFVMQNVKPGCVCIIDSLNNLGGTF